MNSIGPIGRLGRYTATHFRVVAIAWAVVAVALGAFAPKVEHALSGVASVDGGMDAWIAAESPTARSRAPRSDRMTA